MPLSRARKVTFALKFIAGVVGAGAGLTAIIMGAAAFFRPDISQKPVMPSAEAIAEAKEARAVNMTPENPPVIWRDVDYSEGQRAAWWPKAESPIFTDLVKEGKLPPVAERTGPEPVVLAGVDGNGNYGGTWYRLATSPDDIEGIMPNRLSYPSLVRWSPQGHPIVPHIAKSWEVSADSRVWTFHLRKGLRWSDGAPFTADDILFWWKHEIGYFKTEDKNFGGDIYSFMRNAGKLGDMEKVDDLTIRFIFPDPNSGFIEKLAGAFDYFRPVHYLKKFHPELGDQKLIAEMMESMKLPSPTAVYAMMKKARNPECPRMWPWIYAEYRSSAPQILVRNPYYFAVDTAGNQLPYLDRMVIDVKNKAMLVASVAAGEVSFQERFIDFEDYTLLMSEAPRRNYRVMHWYNSTRTMMQMSPNLNRNVNPLEPESKWKHQLLNEKSFRQALSLGIKRQEIIDAVTYGVGEPAQDSPGPDSPYYNEQQFKAFTDYDPARANAMLDALKLHQRDGEGYRTYPDGTRMTWFLNLADAFPPDAAQMVADDWNRLGVRTIVQIHPRTLWQIEQAAREQDFTLWTGLEEFMPMLDPRYYVPTTSASFFAPAWGRWYSRGGTQGDPAANQPGLEAPPEGHPARTAMDLYDQAQVAPSAEARIALFHKILDLAAENLWTINVATSPPGLAIVKDGFRNVPKVAAIGYYVSTPGNVGLETFFWDQPESTPAVIAQIKHALTTPSSLPRAQQATAEEPHPGLAGKLLSWGIWTILLAGLALICLKHPFVWRRLLTLIPTMIVISVVVFAVVRMPPGDFATVKAFEFSMNGDPNAASQIADLKKNYHLDDPSWKQYARWIGLLWFVTYDQADAGLLQGNLGRSMERNQPVSDVIGDALVLTVVVSVLTIIFTWVVALPIGIYSAVKPYTISDYVLTLVGFAGMSIPPFLFALVLMYISSEYFGLSVSGLFSIRYAADPVWTWGKIVDLLQHVWVPIIVLGAGSTAVMIRVMRANLLDELKKPYVVAARAKGVRPLKLLLKYPVRMSLNPFVSGLAGLFPQLISGGAIVALVLSLPIIGPMLMMALLNMDTYFAASMLMILSVLGAAGTLVSDLLLLWLDPRIRLGGGSK